MTAIAMLNHVADPLTAGIAMARAIDSRLERGEFLRSLLAEFGQKTTPGVLASLARLAADLTGDDADSAAQLARHFSQSAGPASLWFGAALLEAQTQFVDAATALEGMPDRDWAEMRAMRLLGCARNRLRAGQDAWLPLREAIRCAQSRALLTAADRLIAQYGPFPSRARRRLALLGSGSLQFWPAVLRPVALAAGVELEIHTGEFDQYRQEILDPASAVAAFRPEIVLLATEWRSILTEAAASNAAEGLRLLWTRCTGEWGAAVIQHGFEIPEVDPLGRLSASLPAGSARALRQLNQELAAGPAAFLDVDQIAGLYGKQRWSDGATWVASKQYPNPDALPFLARHQSALLRALCGLTSKCAVVDLDGTLWGGTIGEDGVEGIRLGGSGEGEAYLSFQRYLLGLRERGIPLAVCSKNNRADALEPFEKHPEMLLRPEHFAVFFANWESKPDNLRAIASSLQLGTDSLVFLDDHPVERARVRAELPEVEVPEMPLDPALYAAALHRSLLFESLSLTDEDRGRAEAYRENAQRESLRSAAGSVEDFLAALDMRIELRPFDRANLPRIVQLINKTNQFNLTTRRVTAASVERLIGDPSVYTQFMRLRDRFGDSGITGVLVAYGENGQYRIDQWLLSCRVLGRRVEDVMLTGLVRHASARGAFEIAGEYIPTAKNSQVAEIYPKFGFERREDGFFHLPLGKNTSEFPAWATVDSED